MFLSLLLIKKKGLIPFFYNFYVYPYIYMMDKQKYMKKCVICSEEKELTEFYSSQRGKKCKDCILKITRDYKRNKRLDDEFKQLESVKQKERRIRLWQNTLIHDSKHRKIENTLTVDDINEMYEKQNGLCFWFGVPMIPTDQNKHPQQPSIDRLDRTKGYTKENVVLCCYSANIGRNENDIETWESFISLLLNR